MFSSCKNFRLQLRVFSTAYIILRRNAVIRIQLSKVLWMVQSDKSWGTLQRFRNCPNISTRTPSRSNTIKRWINSGCVCWTFLAISMIRDTRTCSKCSHWKFLENPQNHHCLLLCLHNKQYNTWKCETSLFLFNLASSWALV